MIDASLAVKIVAVDAVTHGLTDGRIEIQMPRLHPGEEVSLDGKRWMVILALPDGRAWLEPKSAT